MNSKKKSYLKWLVLACCLITFFNLFETKGKYKLSKSDKHFLLLFESKPPAVKAYETNLFSKRDFMDKGYCLKFKFDDASKLVALFNKSGFTKANILGQSTVNTSGYCRELVELNHKQAKSESYIRHNTKSPYGNTTIYMLKSLGAVYVETYS